MLSLLVWGQLVLASDYPQMREMQALHKAVRCVFAASPWALENTVRAVYAVAHRMPCTRSTVVAQVLAWLENIPHGGG